ncbi:monofunctional biosynthetic peptidoglycan transglycosylase, partial [Ectothiorhodospira mobilis]|uniref:monofunctional biosynthetic peptidoglycan transglycosylase n=1 Tax=Ectothiorhodospira mobilis TaxID=195064 RepID=UPI0030B858F8
MKRPHRQPRILRTLRRTLAGAAGALVLLTALGIGSLRWIDPPTSAFILRHEQSIPGSDHKVPVQHRWIPWEAMSPQAAFAVIAAEDQRFLRHHGFDFGAITAALADWFRGGPLRGASTLSQQTAKNLFLWPESTLGRKTLEAYLTIFMELLWPKRRILEIYLNIAQFGPNIYGIEAASRAYFHKPAAALTLEEAARLAAVLPGPGRMSAAAPSPRVLQRAEWIRDQVRQLHKAGYLEGIGPPQQARGAVPEPLPLSTPPSPSP